MSPAKGWLFPPASCIANSPTRKPNAFIACAGMGGRCSRHRHGRPFPEGGILRRLHGHRQRWERLPVSFAQLPQTRPLPGCDTHIAILFSSAQIGRQISPLHGGQRSARVRGARSRRGLPLLVTFYDSLLRIPGRAAGGGKSASHQDAMLVQRGHYERNGRPASAGEALPLAGPRPADPFASGRAYGPAGREGVRPAGLAATVVQGCFACSARPEERIAFPPAPGAIRPLPAHKLPGQLGQGLFFHAGDIGPGYAQPFGDLPLGQDGAAIQSIVQLDHRALPFR